MQVGRSNNNPLFSKTLVQEELVILVDEQDREIGLMEKMQAHREARLHRAFSIFLFNSKGEMLLQQRAHHKYHSGGLWTNTCCSHPRAGESLKQAADRRLVEEMGMEADMEPIFSFIYRAKLDQGLTEYELDHVLFGNSDAAPELNAEEVADWKYMAPQDVKADVAANPERYTEWFKIVFARVIAWMEDKN